MSGSRNKSSRIRVVWSSIFTALALLVTGTVASAETLLMPERSYRMGVSEVVWGISTNTTTTCTLNFGDGSAVQNCAGADRSYIAYPHTFATAGTFVVTLTVNGEVATVPVKVYDVTTLTGLEVRGLDINRAIENGLRSLWFYQSNRGDFNTNAFTNFGNLSMTGLVVLAFENHGYTLPNNNNAPTGIYEKYLVQRGLNYIGHNIRTLSLTVQPAGSPCVGPGIEAAPCTGLYNQFEDPGYGTAVAALAFAGSGALARTFDATIGAGINNFVGGKSYREVLQRMMNAIAFGQNDSGTGQGGWIYQFSNNSGQESDGSTVGWDILALLDAGAAGITIPGFVKTEFAKALDAGQNTDGTFDYRANGNPATQGGVGGNFARAAINLQGLFYVGQIGLGNAEVQAARDALNIRWDGAPEPGDYTSTCGGNNQNLACAYAMYNAFKGLKLHNIATMPASTRAAGPGPIVAKDWHAEYEDYLMSSQVNPATTAGGYWQFSFSCCGGNFQGVTAIAELMLAPVALIAPDPTKFSTIGLRQGNPLSTNPMNNVVRTNHTVTAKAESDAGAPIPGVTISFQVTGRNSKTGQGITDTNGVVTFTYLDGGAANSPGTDTIKAFIGQIGSNIQSNVLTKNWVLAQTKCDADTDGDVDSDDLVIIRMANGKAASGPNDPRDGNSDKKINVADARFCQLRCTLPGCAVQ